MKLKKFFISAVMIGLLTSFTVQTAYAVDIGNELNTESSEKSIVGIYPKIEKEDVSYSYAWSDFKRVSNNLNTYGSDGGTNKVMEKNEYTVKTPIYGEYKLINN